MEGGGVAAVAAPLCSILSFTCWYLPGGSAAAAAREALPIATSSLG